MTASRDAVVTLRSGRRLGYATFGDPDGFPVLTCHGGLLSRLDSAGVDADARALGVRVISPDRPGVGLSDRWPGHSTLDWASDAQELLEHCDVVRFACLGWSMGGQYAAAVSLRLGERVTRSAIVAGCLPLDATGRLEQLGRLDRALGGAATRFSTLAQAMILGLRVGARRTERKLGLPRAAMSEGLRNPAGVVDEYRAFLAPWGFRLEDVAVPVDVWHGGEDELVPPAWAPELARLLSAANLVVLEGAGHMIGITHRAEVIRKLISET